MKRVLDKHTTLYKKARMNKITPAELSDIPDIPHWPALPGMTKSTPADLDSMISGAMSGATGPTSSRSSAVGPTSSRSAPAMPVQPKPVAPRSSASSAASLDMSRISKDVNAAHSSPLAMSDYKAQMVLLQTRATQFRTAAKQSLDGGDRETAKRYLASFKTVRIF